MSKAINSFFKEKNDISSSTELANIHNFNIAKSMEK